MRRALALLFVLAAGTARADDFGLKDGDRVVFYGDSITDQRLYTTFAETFAVTRFPGRDVSFIHSGWGGDRVGGGGGGPIDRRLYRDVIAYRPTVVTVMLGMNDASYRPFEDKIFETYANGYKHLVAKLKEELPGVRLTLIEPSPYDDVTREPKFEGGYNAVLLRYGDFVKRLAGEQGSGFADLNTGVVDALKKAAAADKAGSEKLIADRVHPGPGGQLLMAGELLKAWRAPSVVSTVKIEGREGKVIETANTEVSGFTKGDGLSWTQLDAALPMPIDMKDPVVALAMASSDFIKSLNQQILAVALPEPAPCVLKIDGEEIGTFSREQLADGLNLATLNTPMARQAAEVHRLTLKHAAIHNKRWRDVQVPLQDEAGPALNKALAALDEVEAEVVQRQRAAAQPRPHRFELTQKK